MTRIYTIFLRAFFGLWLFQAVPLSAEPAAPLTVVELFSSQGCDKCPPAVALLRELEARGDVLALNYSIDYWDYLGWQDTFSDPAFTRRQEAYNQALTGQSVYTPQIIIDGAEELVGSKRAEVVAAIERRKAARGDRIVLDVTRIGDDITVRIPAASTAGTATIWLVLYDRSQHVDIGAGDNAGKELDYVNVVRELKSLGAWSGSKRQISFSIDSLMSGGRDGCAILLQEGETGPILAAAILPV